MLNWRRDPGYEKSIVLHEQRMNENRIAIERSKERTKQIEKEIEQLRQETARLKTLNASVRQLCFPPESSSSPQTPTAADYKTS